MSLSNDVFNIMKYYWSHQATNAMNITILMVIEP